jgi:Domain of unknown function (DUF1707)
MDDRFRTSDADRDRAAAVLRDHFAAGRLNAAELDERLAAALNAKTFGELRRVLADLPEPGQAEQPGHLPPDRGRLERGYRRLLACYPAAYRRVHEEEMLAVLMTAAPDGKRWPGMAEAADLIWGALRVRCQPSRSSAEPGWRDALEVVSILLPLIVFITTAVQVAAALPVILDGAPNAFRNMLPLWLLTQFTGPLALLALSLLRLQRTATRATVALLIGLAYLAILSYRAGGPDPGQVSTIAGGPYIMLGLGLQMAAVTASPGPRRGLQLLTWKHFAFTVIAAVAVAITSYPWTVVVIPVICAAMALTSSLGRWLLVLLAIPLGPYVAVPYLYGSPWGPHMSLYIPALMSPSAPGPVGQACILAAVFLGVFLIAACRESLRSRKLAPPSR